MHFVPADPAALPAWRMVSVLYLILTLVRLRRPQRANLRGDFAEHGLLVLQRDDGLFIDLGLHPGGS
jgi:hypothetical protein